MNAVRELPRWGQMVSVALLSTVLSVLPVYLLGAVAIFARADLGLSESTFGGAVAIFYATAAVASTPGGWIGERLGSRRTLAVAGACSCLSLLLLATVVSNWLTLALVLAVAGSANALGQPAANLLVARQVTARRQGTAFGVKQAAVPGASMLGGLSVPVLAATLGWRVTCLVFCVLTMFVVGLILAWVPARTDEGRVRAAPPPVAPPGTRAVLIVFALAGGVAVTASSTIGPFFVESTASHGLGAGAAGLVLACGGTLGMVARVCWGWLADRRGHGRLLLTTWLMIGGACGFWLMALAHGHSTPVLLVATALVFAAGWGWNGVFTYAIVMRYPHAPAAATGVTLSGFRLGGIVGPFVFGIILQHFSYGVAWSAVGTSMALAAVALIVTRNALVRSRKRSAVAREPLTNS